MKRSLLNRVLLSALVALSICAPAQATKTNFNATTLKNAFVLPINAADLALAETAADVGNGNMFPVGDGGVLIIHNTHATTAYTFTISTMADAHGRTGDITAYSLPAGEVDAIWIPPTGVEQFSGADVGKVYVSGSNAAIKFTYLKLPANARAR